MHTLVSASIQYALMPSDQPLSTSQTTIELPGRGPRATELYEYLRSEILSGGFAPNDRIVEQAIAKRSAMSRTPVREALKRLEMDGLVKSEGRGLIVVSHTNEELAELCVAREGLEAFTARLAAASASGLELETLRGLLELSRAATVDEDVDRLVELNHSFHETIWQSARNRYLARQLGLLRGLIERRQPTTLIEPLRREQALKEHEAILLALESRNGDEAEAACRTHFRRAMAARLLVLASRGSSTDAG